MIVDNSIAVHWGLITYLELHADFELAAGAFSGLEAISRYITEKPDLVLMAIDLPDCRSIDLMQYMHEVNHRVPIVVLTTTKDAHLTQAALAAGAACIVNKDMRKQDLVSSIREVVDEIGKGNVWLLNSTEDIIE
jgi:DNA-binding NarL/FixJ family response regulator